MIWLTGDQHFQHSNIIEYCDRPYTTVENMDNDLIEYWNKYVKPDDLVYCLGDFTLGNRLTAESFFRRLNGYIRILENPWHHDKRWLRGQSYRSIAHDVVYDQPIFVLEHEIDVPIILCHYPFEQWDRKHYGAIHFHGHSHGTVPHIKNRLDVGVDNANKLTGEYRPLSLDEAVEFARLDV